MSGRQRSLEELRQLLARRPSEGLAATTLPAPSMTMAQIASRLGDLWSETSQASISGATLADGIAWTNLRGDLLTKTGNLMDLAFQVAEQEQQQQALSTWATQAQAYIQSLQAQLSTCQLSERAPHVTDAVAGAIAVGSALVGGIVGFMGGRHSAGGKWWPWTS